MTREEAIVILKDEAEYKKDYPYDRQAFEMAIKALEQEPCENAISREAVQEEFADYVASGFAESVADFEGYTDIIMTLPSVTPIRRKGHWIDRQLISKIDGEIRNGWECSECGERFFRYDLVNTDEFIPNYCPNCGAEMESENV